MRTLLSVLFLSVALIGCTSTKVTETPPGSGNYATNYVVDPRLVTAIETAKAVNDATAPVNPFSGAVEIGLGAVAALAAWFAKRKNDQANQHALLLKTVVQGVENAGNSEVKATIQKHAVNIGVEGDLSSAVAKINSGLQ